MPLAPLTSTLGAPMRPVVTIPKSELAADPSARLWALAIYLANHPETQERSEYLAFWLAYSYDAEVLNGGHLQYFHNRGTKDVPQTLEALRTIGANEHAALLEGCWHKVQREPISHVQSLEEYSVLATDRSFIVEDSAYYALRPEILDLLEKHFAQLFVESVAISA